MSLIQIPISHGELVDKITILEIKSERMNDEGKLTNVRHELAILTKVWNQATAGTRIGDAQIRLKAVNEKLWDIEDRIRHKESQQIFDDSFVAMARAVYFTNDERAAIKKEINLAMGSELIEEKSYQNYKL